MPSFIPLGRYKITYLDGREEFVRSNFGGIMELEAALPDATAPDGTVLCHGVWIYLGRPGDDLRSWAADVYRIDPAPEEINEAAADPTPPVAGVA